MNVTNNPAFNRSRKNVDTPAMQALGQDLINAAENNILLSDLHLSTIRYHFHIINSRDIAVTVKLSRYNNISVRGKICNRLDDMFKAIESCKD